MAKVKTWAWWITHPAVNWDNMVGELRYRLITKPKAAYQRARYGWSLWDISGPGFDNTTVRWTGQAMVALADQKTGYPMDYPNMEAWQQDLRFYGYSLQVAGDSAYSDEDIEWVKKAYPEWWADAFNDAIQRASPLPLDRIDQIAMWYVSQQIGTSALHWVADHYGSLWD